MIADPQITFRDLLISEWDDTNTLDITPGIFIGWFDESRKYPHITLSNMDDSHGGAGTGYIGIDGGGGGPVQLRSIIVPVNLWAHRSMKAPDNETLEEQNISPKALLWAVRQEVIRIVINNVDAVAGFEYISPGDFVFVNPEVKRQPTLYRYSGSILGRYFQRQEA